MLKKLREGLIFVFFILLAAVPFAFGSTASLRNYQIYGYFGFVFSLLVLLFAWVLFIFVRSKLTGNVSEWVIILLLFLSPILIRWVGMIFFNIQPTSDFLRTIESAAALVNGPYTHVESARFPYLGQYRITLGLFFEFFGASVTRANLFNIFLAGPTAVGIYFLGKKISYSRKFGFIAALVYILWPADILYKNLPTGEHIFALLFPYVCLLFLFGMEYSESSYRKGGVLLLFSGLGLGLMEMYKPVALVLLIAFLITIILYKVFPYPFSKTFYGERKFWQTLSLFGILIIAFWGMKEMSYATIQYAFKAQPNRYAFGGTLRVGLDVEYKAKWNLEIAQHVSNLLEETNYDYPLVNSILLAETQEMVMANSSELDSLFLEKLNYMWSSDQQVYAWITKEQVGNGLTAFNPQNLTRYIWPWMDSYFVFLLVSSTIGAIYCAFAKRNPGSLVTGLFIFGFALLLLVTENQQRYRSVTVSAIPIFTVYGIYALNHLAVILSKKYENLMGSPAGTDEESSVLSFDSTASPNHPSERS